MLETSDGSKASNKGQIRAFLARHIRGEFLDGDDLFATARINSLFALQLVMFAEKQFKIRVENEDLELKSFCSVDAIFEFVERKLSAQSGAQLP